MTDPSTTADVPRSRVGAVRYLNSRPLIEGLAARLAIHDTELVCDVPSRLAAGLACQWLDVALVPSIDVCRHSGYEIVSDACVATRGPVLSVKLYTRVPWRQVRTLALDEGSLTSATLSRILLKERFGIEPTVQPLLLGQSTTESTADAILLIGDRAMFAPPEAFVATWDLGEEWTRWTGLPFVFAVWAARRGQVDEALAEALSAARDDGVANLHAIAERESPLLGLPYETTIHYLQHNLYFYLTPREQLGLERFCQLAVRHGLCEEREPLVFRDCTTAR